VTGTDWPGSDYFSSLAADFSSHQFLRNSAAAAND